MPRGFKVIFRNVRVIKFDFYFIISLLKNKIEVNFIIVFWTSVKIVHFLLRSASMIGYIKLRGDWNEISTVLKFFLLKTFECLSSQ